MEAQTVQKGLNALMETVAAYESSEGRRLFVFSNAWLGWVTVGAAAALTIWVKHSGDKPNCGRLVWVLLRKLYQKLKRSCRETGGERGGRETEGTTERA